MVHKSVELGKRDEGPRSMEQSLHKDLKHKPALGSHGSKNVISSNKRCHEPGPGESD